MGFSYFVRYISTSHRFSFSPPLNSCHFITQTPVFTHGNIKIMCSFLWCLALYFVLPGSTTFYQLFLQILHFWILPHRSKMSEIMLVGDPGLGQASGIDTILPYNTKVAPAGRPSFSPKF